MPALIQGRHDKGNSYDKSIGKLPVGISADNGKYITASLAFGGLPTSVPIESLATRALVSPHRRVCGNLPLTGIVDGFPQDAGCFLGCVESHGILGGDKVDTPLGLALQFERGF